jgi:hypothetical protein
MRAQDGGGAPLCQILERRERGADASVVGDGATLQRDVEIDAHQGPLATEFNIAYRFLGEHDRCLLEAYGSQLPASSFQLLASSS